MQRYRNRILAAARNPKTRAAIPTKRTQRGTSSSVTVTVKIPKRRAQTSHLTIDDIESFQRVRKIARGLKPVKMAETKFKNGVATILGEPKTFKDWGGELRDLSSTHLRLDGKRRASAFAFKGPVTSGRLTPGKMGKNGDQIQRLVRCPAEVFVIQYWSEIDDAVL